MFFIPLNQIESVQLVVNALKMAGGEADCSTCPAVKVCMKQCLSIAASVEKMAAEGALPALREGDSQDTDREPAAGSQEPSSAENDDAEAAQKPDPEPGPKDGKPGHLKVIK